VTPEPRCPTRGARTTSIPSRSTRSLAWGLAEAGRGDAAAAGRIYTKAILEPAGQLAAVYFRAKLLEKVAGPKAALFDAQQAAAARSAWPGGALRRLAGYGAVARSQVCVQKRPSAR